MRILQAHTRYRQAGGEDSVADMERSMLEEAGHAVRVHRVDNPTGTAGSVGALARSPWNRAAARAVVRAAEEHEADVVHVHNTWFALSPAVFGALSRAGFPVVATIHNYRPLCVNALLYRDGGICEDCVGKLPWRGVIHRCYRGSAVQSAAVAVTITTQRMRTWDRDVDRIVVLTHFAADELARGGLPYERMVVKPNSAPDPGPRAVPPSASDTVLFVGRLTEEKGITDLVEAWNQRSSDGLRLEVVGDGPLREAVARSAGPGVDVVGRRTPDEVRTSMLAARALVFPSRWFEGLPMVMVEGLAAGLPIVVFDRGAMVEIADAGGLVCEGGGVAALTSALDRLADGATVDTLGRGARATYEKRHRPSVGVDMLVDIYQRARAVGSGP